MGVIKYGLVMKCTVIFTRSRDGEIEMCRQIERSINQEGATWDESMRAFGKRLTKSLQRLSVNQRLVLNCELQDISTRQVNDD